MEGRPGKRLRSRSSAGPRDARSGDSRLHDCENAGAHCALSESPGRARRRAVVDRDERGDRTEMTTPDPDSAIEIAERAGFDMSLIRVSLGYSYDQRAIQHQAALDLMLEMERAGQKLRDSAQPAPRPPPRR